MEGEDFWAKVAPHAEAREAILGELAKVLDAMIGQMGHALRDVQQLTEMLNRAGIELVQAYRAMPYPIYLQTIQWKRVRDRALTFSQGRCQLCKAGGVLDVHHNTYDRLGQEKDADVVVLCRECHGKFHDKLPAPPRDGK